MKCYYQIEDGEWIKGQLVSMGGNTEANFCPEDDHAPDSQRLTLYLSPTSIGFHYGDSFSICGYQNLGLIPNTERVGYNTYKLTRVDVSPGWRIPKKKG